MQRSLLEHLETVWREPDEGIWEVRGERRHFTHSKVMAWVAFDRAVRSVEGFGLDGPVEPWRQLRQEIHDDVCRHGFDPELNAFVQSYGSKQLDASLLLLPVVGFLPPEDPRIRGTVAAIERQLLVDGFVLRYDSAATDDGLPPGEGAFLACSFWLADAYVMLGRTDEARRLFERLLSLRNDVGLLAEEYDPGPAPGRQLPAGLLPPGAGQHRPQPDPDGEARRAAFRACRRGGRLSGRRWPTSSRLKIRRRAKQRTVRQELT